MKNATINNEIRVEINNDEERLAKVEKALKILAKQNAVSYRNKNANIINENDWSEYDNMNDEDKNDLLTKMVINRGFKSVQKIRNHKGENADYIYVNNISYVIENFPHIVADMYARIESYYKMKYPHNVHHAIRCAVANSIYHCKEDDHDTKTTALFVVNDEGEERCVVDTEGERSKDYEINVEEKAIFNATIHSMKYYDQCIAYDHMDGYQNKEIGIRVHYKWNAKETTVSGQAIGKEIRTMKKYF